jgi:hypothetical protein
MILRALIAHQTAPLRSHKEIYELYGDIWKTNISLLFWLFILILNAKMMLQKLACG